MGNKKKNYNNKKQDISSKPFLQAVLVENQDVSSPFLQAVLVENQDISSKPFLQSVAMRNITEEEYHNLKKENFDLRTKILGIYNNERLLQETINNSKILTEEKNEMKQKILDLETMIKKIPQLNA